MFDKNSENYVLLCENTFYEKWQSGRINFFWGGFSAFMVYALTLISDGQFLPHFLFGFPQTKTAVGIAHGEMVTKINTRIYMEH